MSEHVPADSMRPAPVPGETRPPKNAPPVPDRELSELHLLFRVVNLMHSSMDAAHIARITLTAVTAGTALGMNRAAVLVCDGEAGTLRGYMAVGPNTREEAAAIWARLGGDPLSLEDLVGRALGAGGAAADLALFERVGALRLPLAELGDGPLARALDGEGSIFGDDDVLPHALRAIFDGPAGMILPMRSVDGMLGVIVADRFSGSRDGMELSLPLAVEVAHQAGIAMSNAQQLSEVRVRAAELATLHELGKKFLATHDVADDVQILARCASEAASARSSAIFLGSESGKELAVEARWNLGDARPSPELEGALHTLAESCVREQKPVLVRDSLDPLAPPGLGEARSLVCVPLIAYGRGIGALVVFDRIARSSFETPAFDRNDLQFLCTLADQASIAIENLRLLERFRSSERRLRETQALLLANEKLAALGEMSAKVAHEIRNPLAAIGGFARRISRTVAETDPNHEYIHIIVREAERLERILSEQLQFAQLSRPRLALEDLNQVMGQTIQLLGPSLLERRVRLIKRMGPDIPRLLLDADKIKQVLLNILQNALQNVSTGGRIKVETQNRSGSVQIDVANDGPRIPGDVMERLFVPFFTSRQNGTGLGLAVADQIVHEHGGEIRVRCDADWGCIFTVVLPVDINGDRRAGIRERRARVRADRRRPAA